MSSQGKRMVLRTDGASRGNPGPAALGVVLEDGSGVVVGRIARALGVATNNQAEYRALLAGLKLAAKLGAEHLDIRLDSELIVRQVRGQYRVKDAVLRPLYQEVMRALEALGSFSLTHVSHQENRQAHQLAAQALDSLPR